MSYSLRGIAGRLGRFAGCAAATAVILCLGLGSSFFLASEDGLVGHWRFDVAADSVKDSSGHGHAAHVGAEK